MSTDTLLLGMLTLLAVLGCERTESSKKLGNTGATTGAQPVFQLAPEHAVVLELKKAGYLKPPCVAPDIESGWAPSAEEIALLEGSLRRIHDDLRGKVGVDDGINHYVRQYTGIVVGGEKQIYVRAMTKDTAPTDWHTVGTCHLGGGNSQWRAVFVPKLGEFFDFHVGG